MTSLSDKTINNALTRSNSAEIAGFAMPGRGKAVQMGTQTYTAPANGWAFFQASPGVANGYVSIVCNDNTDNYRQVAVRMQVASNAGMVIMPCEKGDEVGCNIQANGTIYYNVFFYAEGEK